MKRLIVMLALILMLIAGCKIDPIWEFDEIPDLGIQNVRDAMEWVGWEINYVDDAIHYPADEYWQSPAQTYVWRSGDCEDFAILVLYLIHRDVGQDGRLIIGTLWGYGHAWVQVDGHFWEPQLGHLPDVYRIIDGNRSYVIYQSISYKDAIRRSTTDHKSLTEEPE